MSYLAKKNKSILYILQILIAVVFFMSSNNGYAQKGFWGTVLNNGLYEDGYLFQTNATGDNLEIVHHFLDSMSGRGPTGIIQASNGKLYGLTSQGGLGNNGTLYEYNPVIDSLRLLVSFDTLSFPPYYTKRPDNMGGAYVGLTEAIPGTIYGQFNSGNPSIIFSYNLITGGVSVVASIPNPLGANFIRHPLYKSSNGFIYATTHNHSLCGSSSPRYNSIIRIDPATNVLSTLYRNSCSALEGLWSAAPFIEESPEEWYGIAEEGGTANEGVIFSFDPTTNIYTKKYDFEGGAQGGRPRSPLIKAANGKIYGSAGRGSPDPPNVPGGSGIIFEFDPTTGVYQKKLDFRYGNGSIYLVGTDGILKLKGSNSMIYGATRTGLFEYNVESNTTRAAGRFGSGMSANSGAVVSLIEICRPPVYQYYPEVTYTRCEGEALQHDLLCTNATSVIWKHNNIVDPSRTSPVLDFELITPADTGTWVCELTNECGTTIPPPIHLKFNTANPPVTQTNNILEAPTAETYQWVDCLNNYAALDGETAPTFIAMDNGQYAVILTNGICTDTSACYTVNITSANEMLSQDKLTLYPNPATDKLELHTKGDIRIYSVQVMSLTGEILSYTTGNTLIEVSHLPAGLYFISAQTSQGSWRGKFMKR